MNVTFKNLSVTFNQTDADFSGDALLTIPEQYVQEFIEDTEGCQYGTDEVDNYNEYHEGKGDFELRNTDYQIIFMNWAFAKDEVISFSYEGDNLFWLYHDFHHAMNDVTGLDIYVNGQLEAERHYQAIEVMKERNEIHHIDAEFLAKHVHDFKERSKWANNFNADDFDFQKACELAGFDNEEIWCSHCDSESEPIELTEEEREEADDYDHTHKCEDCGNTGEKWDFYHEREYYFE